jgi:hypothetical protein
MLFAYIAALRMTILFLRSHFVGVISDGEFSKDHFMNCIMCRYFLRGGFSSLVHKMSFISTPSAQM